VKRPGYPVAGTHIYFFSDGEKREKKEEEEEEKSAKTWTRKCFCFCFPSNVRMRIASSWFGPFAAGRLQQAGRGHRNIHLMQ
jgi:hypothetical protein